MTDNILAFVGALSISTWIYAKMMHNNGGVTKNSLIVAGGLGIFIFIIIRLIFSYIA